ncbi:hypothetical protein BGZ80_005992 [Entomortierella chlamydospora]|uniref:Uncharacterized protein n=1 Tax=Entomortierella chlamydospora TaxID=101097 RepID=A0A9P6SU76_9FUNG|nr:hypothetical protein BGZ80_005992 [Entomortierella chlamydospora]
MAATHHRKSLEVIMTFDPCNGFYDGDLVPEPIEYVWETDVAVQQLLHTCPCVKEFQLPELEMDLDEVEKAKWACKNLEVFCARIRGLDTKEKITRTLQLWIEGKSKKKKRKKRRLTDNGEMWRRDLVDSKDVEIFAVAEAVAEAEASLPLVQALAQPLTQPSPVSQPPHIPPPPPPVPAVKGGLSIEERVARHLLRFDELKEVWLGTKVWIA